MFLWNIAVTSLAEVWIEIYYVLTGLDEVQCHFPCGSVDWNYDDDVKGHMISFRHFPCGSVDWNVINGNKYKVVEVTSLAEVWIEIPIA